MKFRRMTDSTQDSTTFIGEGTTFTGQMSGTGCFVICGRFDGDCEVDGSLTIAVDGHWKGTIKASNVIIAGSVDGDVIAKGQVEVAATAGISGKLSGASIAVAEGAVIDGSINVTGANDVVTFTERRSERDEISSDEEVASDETAL